MTNQSGRQALAPDPTHDELVGILDRQRAAFLIDGVPTADVRRDRVDRLMLAVLENADAIADALDRDYGSRPKYTTLASEVLGSITDAKLIHEQLDDWMTPDELPSGAAAGTPTFVQHRPKGVVGIIGPWNFPISLVVRPALEALAAGNRVMIKMSEIPSRTADIFAQAIAQYFSPLVIAVVRGGMETGVSFSSLPFDHLFFTGSPAVGRKIAAAAGANLVPVTLELGGKNPAVVAADADLDVAAERIATARMMNGGQVCLCPDYAMVPRAKVDAFVAGVERSVRKYFPSYETNPGVVSIVNDANYARVLALIEDARDKGASPSFPLSEGDFTPNPITRRIPPVVLKDVTDDMRIAHEEVFGPVLTVIPYDDVETVIDYVAARPSPLAAYWYGDDTDDYRRFLQNTTSGGVTRNDMALHYGIDDAPFGGIGQSGIGGYHGKTGFDAFSHHRTITASDLPTSRSVQAMPPYEDAVEAIRSLISSAAEGMRGQIGQWV